MDKYLDFFYNHTFFDNGEGGTGGGTPPAPKTFNQDEVNGIVGDSIAKERAKIYKLFGVEDEDGLRNISTQMKTLSDENAKYKVQVEQYTTEKTLAEKKQKLTEAGIDPDFMDVAISKWDGKQDIAKFVEANPKLTTAYFQNGGQQVFQGTGNTLGQRGGANVDITKLSTEDFMKLAKEGKLPT